jgi:hypothetical protein
MSLRTLLHRDVPRDWETRLAELSPPTNRFTWLRLRWEPGVAWEEPVERFIIDQMMPARMMTSEFHKGILEQLERSTPPQGYYDQVLGRYVHEDHCLITTRAWELFRLTNCWATSFWVIQGSHGGHQWEFTAAEKKLLRFMGLPDEAPAPGDLPYAPFDERVVEKLIERDTLRELDAGLSRSRAVLAGAQSRRQERQERDVRERIAKLLRDQMADVGAEMDSALEAMGTARRIISREENIALEAASEQAEENYLTHGRTNGGLPIITS